MDLAGRAVDKMASKACKEKNGREGEQFLPLYIDLHAPGGQRIGEIPSSSLFKHTQQELFAKNNIKTKELTTQKRFF